MDDSINKLTDLFKRFPGVGPRQARRFVYFLLKEGREYQNELTRHIGELQNTSHQCTTCYRFYVPRFENEKKGTCVHCLPGNKEESLLMIVEKDADLENIERSGVYQGRYFVLGSLSPILDETSNGRGMRLKELKSLIKKDPSLGEIIIALAANMEGDHTAHVIQKELEPLTAEKNMTVTFLGRGLSTGTELEYSDTDTLRNALNNRG